MSSRACDRCWALKTQCDSQSPCARCRRLGLPCLTERPVRAKGRPRKSVSSRQDRAVREPSVEPESQSSGQEIRSSVSTADVSSIPLDPSLIDSLLQRLLSSSRKLGIFGLLPDSLHADTEARANFSVRQILNAELQNALLAIALDLYCYRLPETVAGSLDVSRDHLQMRALADTPCLTWKSHELQLGNALLLLLFSYTWCLNSEFADIAVRWLSLSRIIHEDISKSSIQDDDWNELTRRTEMSLYIQDADHQHIGVAAQSEEAELPIPSLHQITDGTRDLVDLIMNPVYHEADRFSYLLEHSLLLGDVLPTVLSLDPYLESLSPATIIFLLQSTTIHAIALRQFFSDNSNHALLENGVPAKLVRSSDHHHSLLSAIELHCKRYDIPIIGEIRTLLSTCLSRAAFRNTDARIISTQQLMHYRWCNTGTGIIHLQRVEAVAAWQYPVSPGEELWQQPSDNRDELQPLIVDLCAPNTRLCRNGYFDLSILIR
ncbi:hypothetical protein COH21_005612 [Aspergillus flavus]|nr:hypothetical protein COH21_005612 [Aspergillus flavus]